jgi:hypothetical protein
LEWGTATAAIFLLGLDLANGVEKELRVLIDAESSPVVLSFEESLVVLEEAERVCLFAFHLFI